ncbi:MAG: 5-formyltetrahydrofolate cyclo-ligase [Paludibacteraceae bacterium]|nr:5-formyltetrahydrofolate cyclo-ligase [Paludibacteraceae bacterium]
MYMFQSVIEDIKKLLPSYKTQKQKKDLRAHLLQKRRLLTADVVATCSDEVVTQLLGNPAYQQAKTVMFYYPANNEINLLRLAEINPEKQFLLPVTHRHSIEVRPFVGKDNLKRGKFGIPEPQTPTFRGNIDLLLVPGVGYDNQLYRLGRGGGYYDRFISSLKKAHKIGIGYRFQLVEHIPHNHHDRKMDEIILSQTN